MKLTVLICCVCSFLAVSAQNIGIGTTTPSEKLHVNGNVRMDTAKANALKIIPNAGTGKVLTSDNDGNAGWQSAGNSLTPLNGITADGDSLNLGGRLYKKTEIALAENELNFNVIGPAIVTVANSAPAGDNLSLNGLTVTQTFIPAINCQLSDVQLNITALGNASITLELKNETGAVLGVVTKTYTSLFNGLDAFRFDLYLESSKTYTLSVTGNANAFINYDLSSNAYPQGTCSIGPNADLSFNIIGSGEEKLLSLSDSRVGIGTNTPAEKLDVNGNVKATTLIATSGIQLANNAGAGKVLVSDATGRGSWANSNSAPGSIALINNLLGSAFPSMPVAAGVWEFFGPSATVVLNGSQRVIMNAVGALGRNAAGTSNFRLDVGYQLEPAGPITNAALGNYVVYQPNLPENDRRNYSMAGSFKPAAGTYKIGCMIHCSSIGYFNNNNFINCTYMVVNE